MEHIVYRQHGAIIVAGQHLWTTGQWDNSIVDIWQIIILPVDDLIQFEYYNSTTIKQIHVQLIRILYQNRRDIRFEIKYIEVITTATLIIFRNV